MERGGSSFTEGIGQGRVTDNLKPDLDIIDDAVKIPDEDSIVTVSYTHLDVYKRQHRFLSQKRDVDYN